MVDKLLVASTHLPPVSGGAERTAWELAKRLSDRFDVHLLTTGATGTVEKGAVTVHYVPRVPLLTLLYSTIQRRQITRLLDAIRPAIVHSHMPLPWAYVFRHESAKKVVTCHGSDVFPHKGYPRKLFLMSAMKHADLMTAASSWLCRYLLRNYDIHAKLLSNGVDTKVFRPLKNIRRAENVVLFVGRFLERKGVFDLLGAARLLPEYEFWFVGDARVKELAGKSVLSPNVRPIGFVDDLVRCYAQATLCVFPSHWENFPLVGLEALACGKATIATTLGFSEYIQNGHDGVLIRPHDVTGLVKSIRYLMENAGLREELEKNAREKAIQYDWDLVAQRCCSLYMSL